MISVFLPVVPVAKQRARVTQRGTYTPQKTRDAENEIGWLMRSVIKVPMEGPLKVDVSFYLEKPKSAPKDRNFPSVRSDLDNFIKLVFDALNGIAWKDDGQVTSIIARKRYAHEGQKIGIRLEISTDTALE